MWIRTKYYVPCKSTNNNDWIYWPDQNERRIRRVLVQQHHRPVTIPIILLLLLVLVSMKKRIRIPTKKPSRKHCNSYANIVHPLFQNHTTVRLDHSFYNNSKKVATTMMMMTKIIIVIILPLTIIIVTIDDPHGNHPILHPYMMMVPILIPPEDMPKNTVI